MHEPVDDVGGNARVAGQDAGGGPEGGAAAGAEETAPA
jgi:hypothetical protein